MNLQPYCKKHQLTLTPKASATLRGACPGVSDASIAETVAASVESFLASPYLRNPWFKCWDAHYWPVIKVTKGDATPPVQVELVINTKTGVICDLSEHEFPDDYHTQRVIHEARVEWCM